MENLLKKMEKIVDERMVTYQSDFYKYDMSTLLESNEGQSFLWYVRETGTHIYKYEIVNLLDHQDTLLLNYWLSAARIYKVDLEKVEKKNVFGQIKELSHDHVKNLLDNARRMTFEEKLQEVKEWAIYDCKVTSWEDRAKTAFKYYQLDQYYQFYHLYKMLNSDEDVSKMDFITALDVVIANESVKKGVS